MSGSGLSEFQRMLKMVQDLAILMGETEGELADSEVDIDDESARSGSTADYIEGQREVEVLEELRQILEGARLELEGVIDIQPEPEEAEPAAA